MDLITDMDQHKDLFPKVKKKIVGKGHKYLCIYPKMQLLSAECKLIRQHVLNS